MPSASVSTVSEPSMIGSWTPGSQIQIVSPIAVSSEIPVSAGTRIVCTKRPRNRPTISTMTEPPTVAISGESAL
jgi:hypothetical protein